MAAEILLWIALGAALMAALGFAMALRRANQDLAQSETQVSGLERDHRQMKDALARAPVPMLEILPGATPGDVGVAPNEALCRALGLSSNADFEALLARLEDASAAALRTGVDALLAEGTAIDLALASREGGWGFALRSQAGDGVGAHLWFQDISALSAALAHAEEAVAELRATFDAIPYPLWRRDGELRVVDCNAAYAQALDTTKEAVLDAGLELLAARDLQKAKSGLSQALARGEASVTQHHVVVSGERRLMEFTEREVGEGHSSGMAVDRTEVEELQAELKRHLDAQAEVLENMGSAIAIFGTDMHMTFYNSAYARLWNLDDSFLQSAPHFGDVLERLREQRRLPEQPDFPAYKQNLIRNFSTLIESNEELIHLPSGVTLRSLIVPYPLGGVLLSYEDVTDRLAIERNYNTLIEVQRATLDNLYEGVSVYGADGLLKLSNPAFAEIWKIPADALEGEPHVRELVAQTRVFYDLDDDAWQQQLEKVVAETTDPADAQGRRERSDGSVIDWARVSLPDGAVLYTFIDVSDSLQVERALREINEALETADRLKSEFIANISYELRTPLNAIIGFAEILTNQFFGELNERQMEYSHAIVESSNRLITLINDILDLASIEAGYLQIDRDEVDVHALMDSVYGLGRERAHNLELDLRLECPEDIGIIAGDVRRLKQALFNLLSNALNFTPKGGRVTLKAERENGSYRLSVIDSGSGISEADRKRVFGRFERGQTQGRQAGAGLGLALVQSLIELHGGRVELESPAGGGVAITCHVPADQPADQSPPEAPEPVS